MIGRASLWSVAALVAGCLLTRAMADAETVGYVEPITIQPPCLACHGTQLDAAVRQKLAELYPEDRATGFAPGELRGMFWVTVPEATQDPGS